MKYWITDEEEWQHMQAWREQPLKSNQLFPVIWPVLQPLVCMLKRTGRMQTLATHSVIYRGADSPMLLSKRAACWHVDKADKLKTLLEKIIKAISAAWMLTWQMVTRVTAFPIDTAKNPRYSLPLYNHPPFLNCDRKNDATLGSSTENHMEPSDLH